MLVRIALVCVLAASAGCTKTNPAFCDADTLCANDLPCDLLTNTCPAECTQDTDCDNLDAPICDVDTTCRGCDDNAECVARDPMFPSCEDGTCAGCVSDDDCSSAQAPVCGAGGACVGCSDNTFCLNKFPGERELCDDSSGACVECLVDATCNAAEPICGAGLCRGCIQNTECPDDVCAEAGTCPDLTQMIRVSKASGNSNADCGTEAVPPCDAFALGLIRQDQTSRLFVRVDDGEHTVQAIIFQDVSIVVPIAGNAKYKPIPVPATRPALLVPTGVSVTVDGLDIEFDDPNPSGPALVCEATSSELRVRRARIAGWLDGVTAIDCGFIEVSGSTLVNQNQSGLFVENSRAVIKNNVISFNGSFIQGDGAINISQNSSFTTELSFNTLVGNRAKSGQLTAGLVCFGDFTAQSNIVFDNELAGSQDLIVQVSTGLGSCTHEFSNIGGLAQAADGNISLSPQFIDDDVVRDGSGDASGFDLHLELSSPCIDAADPTSTEPFDIDGDLRPAGTAPDMGADEAG